MCVCSCAPSLFSSPVSPPVPQVVTVCAVPRSPHGKRRSLSSSPRTHTSLAFSQQLARSHASEQAEGGQEEDEPPHPLSLQHTDTSHTASAVLNQGTPPQRHHLEPRVSGTRDQCVSRVRGQRTNRHQSPSMHRPPVHPLFVVVDESSSCLCFPSVLVVERQPRKRATTITLCPR